MSIQSSNNNKRITKNTLLLYFRMLFMMEVSLYTSRVILKALEVEDFGIYNVVGSMVVVFAAILHINDIRWMGESKGHFYELLFALSLIPYVFLNNDNQKKMFYINQNN